MNILLVGNSYFVAPLRQMGHMVLYAHFSPQADVPLTRPGHTATLMARLDAVGFAPDLLLYCDDGNLPMLLDPQAMPCPSIWYSIDSYCNPWHMAWAHGFDASCVAQKDFVGLFGKEGLRVQWLPLFFNGASASLPFAERDIPVSFVGTIGHRNNPDRAPFLQAFRRRHPLVTHSGDFRDVFARSRIVLNQTAFAEVNFRCFEAMACGSALLMEQCDNGLLDIFTPEVNILPPYQRGNAAEAADIASQWLAQPDRLATLAAQGQELVLKRHSAQVRAREIVTLAKLLRVEGAHDQRLAMQEQRGRFVKAAFGIIASELTQPEMREFQSFYHRQSLA